MQRTSLRQEGRRQSREIARAHLNDTAALMQRIAAEMDGEIAEAALRIERALRRGRKVLLFGNGGSAADAQHLAAELVGRFEKERRPLSAIALVSNPSSVTAIGNDYGFEMIFARQVRALAGEGDVLVGISTSGKSRNVQEGLRAGGEIGCFRIGLLGGDGGSVKEEADLALIVPAGRTCRIQEAHITIGHIICNIIEERLFGERETD